MAAAVTVLQIHKGGVQKMIERAIKWMRRKQDKTTAINRERPETKDEERK
jgi:hypothetical protein